MATSTWSYRRSTNLASSKGDPDGDAAMRKKLEQARQQRTAFYRRLAETGVRAQTDEDGKEVEVDADLSTRRQGRRLDTSSPHCDVVSSISSTNSSLFEQLPEPRSSWRYYTSYDNGEWRRHATPIYKADAEQEIGSSGKLGERRSASMTTGLTTRYDEVDVENGESSSSHSRQTSASGRHQRLRGSACLTRDLPPADTSSATNSGPTTLEEVKTVMKNVFDRSRYGSGYDVSELVQKILGERQRGRDPSPSRTEERVIYANTDRHSILDNATQSMRPTFPEIPEGSDEKEFEEKTLAPSGRRWTSSPSPDSQRIVIVRELLDDDYFDGGLRYEEIGAGSRGCATSMENWRDSSCRSPSNVPDMPNGEGVHAAGLQARSTGAGRTLVTSETTSHHESQTVGEAMPPTSTTRGGKDAFGHRIPTDAVEIKVQMQRGASDGSQQRVSPSKSRLRDERNSAAVEQWLQSSTGQTSPASRERSFVVGGGVEIDEKLEPRSSGTAQRENYSGQVEDVGITPRTSSDDGWTEVTSSKSTAKTSRDDGRIWIPVVHVSGAPASKNQETKLDACPPIPLVETETRIGTAVSPAVGNRGQVGASSRPFVDTVTDRRRQVRSDTAESRESMRHTEDVAEVAGPVHQSAATPSLRTGSGVGSYGFRSSIVVDRGSTHGTQPTVSQTSSSRSSDVRQQSAGGGQWMVKEAHTTQPTISQTSSGRSSDVRQQSAGGGQWIVQEARGTPPVTSQTSSSRSSDVRQQSTGGGHFMAKEAHTTQPTISQSSGRSSDVRQQSTGGGQWMVEKALK